MGKILLFLLWALMWLVPPGWAAAFKTDICLSHCNIERQEDGRFEVLCSCLEKKFPKSGDFFSLKERRPEKFASELEARLRGAGLAERALVGEDACLEGVKTSRAHPRAANEFILLAALAQRPLCECVQNRIHFPLLRSCETSHAGVVLCRFELLRRESRRTGILRDPTLHDYQACIAARLNYRRPETCAAVVCKDKPHACAAEEDLVNVADDEGCCPVFECRSREKS